VLGLLINTKELNELEYILKKEMDELLFELEDSRIDIVVKKAIYNRYQVLFQLYRRVATEPEVLKYLLNYKF